MTEEALGVRNLRLRQKVTLNGIELGVVLWQPGTQIP
jgi:hypothetical protein